MTALSDWCRANPHLAAMEIEQHKTRIEALEKALREIACFPHTPSKNMAAKQMSLIARAALAPETAS